VLTHRGVVGWRRSASGRISTARRGLYSILGLAFAFLGDDEVSSLEARWPEATAELSGETVPVVDADGTEAMTTYLAQFGTDATSVRMVIDSSCPVTPFGIPVPCQLAIGIRGANWRLSEPDESERVRIVFLETRFSSVNRSTAELRWGWLTKGDDFEPDDAGIRVPIAAGSACDATDPEREAFFVAAVEGVRDRYRAGDLQVASLFAPPA
jgi:hypothetical protein